MIGWVRRTFCYVQMVIFLADIFLVCSVGMFGVIMQQVPGRALKRYGKRLQDLTVYILHVLSGYLLFSLRGGRLKFHIYARDKELLERLVKNELSGDINTLIVSNHQSGADISVVSFLCPFVLNCKYGTRFVFKQSLSLIPMFGAFVSLINSIALCRNNKTKDVKRIKRNIRALIHSDSKFCFVVFPEGTRLNKKNKYLLDSTKKYMQNNGLKLTENVLCPRILGFREIYLCSSYHLNNIYDVTIAYYDENKKALVNGLIDMLDIYGRSEVSIHVKIDSYSKQDMEKLANIESGEVLYNWFQAKDEFLSKFTKNKDDDIASLNLKRGQVDMPFAETALAFYGIFMFIVALHIKLGWIGAVIFWFTHTIIGYMGLYFNQMIY